MRLLLGAGVMTVLVFLIVPSWLSFLHPDWVIVMPTVSFFGCSIGSCMATYAIMELRHTDE